MPQADIHALRGLESEFLLQNAQDHDTSGHDGGLGIFGCGESAVRAGGDDLTERTGEEMVEFLEEGGAGAGKGGEPWGGHADALDALAGEEEGGFGPDGGGGGGCAS